MVVRIVACPDVIRVAVRVNPPARRDRTFASTKIVCDPLRIRRRNVCLQNLRLKSELTPDEAQSDVPPIILGL